MKFNKNNAPIDKEPYLGIVHKHLSYGAPFLLELYHD